MANKIQCATHGQCDEAFVCSHLVGKSVGLGFHRDKPSDDNPFPDAWCDDCELIRAAYNEWNDESQMLAQISMVCSRCYEQARIRNTQTNVKLDDLATLRWKCGSCEEWHRGPCLDFSYPSPIYWLKEHQEASRSGGLLSIPDIEAPKTFLDEDYCAIEGNDFFVRGLIHLPIIGTAETFRWGVWGSLSKENFKTLLESAEDPKRGDLPPMFSWLSNQIGEYPDTLTIKMYAYIQEPGLRPIFELERTNHPLSYEYYNGISAQRVREVMIRRLKDVD